jgi:ATP-dependent DNA helicase RecG
MGGIIDAIIGGVDMANLGKENEIIEFKESTAEFDKACKAIVGMLNKSGHGTIYFGVKDNGDVIGQNIGHDTLSTLTDRIKQNIKPDVYPTVLEMQIDDKKIILVTFSGNNKPYAYKGAFYIRVEQQNLQLDPLVIREMVKTSHEYNENWENELTEYGSDYIDEEALDLYYRQALAMGRIQDFKHTPEELMVMLELMRDGKITNAGLYLFGKKAKIVLKAVEYPTTERIDPIDLKRFENNIFNSINLITNFIYSKMRWRVVVDDIQRKEIPEIPVKAIREIVINSLVHADYYGDSDFQVTIDPKTIEIYNPGTFVDGYTPETYINDIIPSRSKHKVIQNILFKAFDIETLGRGFKRMNTACEEAGIKWTYRKFDFGFSFSFIRPNTNSEITTIDNKVSLSNSASILFEYMNHNGGKLESLVIASTIINKKERQTRNIITELIDKGLIERVGSNKTGYWKII